MFSELLSMLYALVADLREITRLDRDESLDYALLVYIFLTITLNRIVTPAVPRCASQRGFI